MIAYGSIIAKLKLNKIQYRYLRYLTRIAKNLHNETMYLVNNHYDMTGKYLGYYDTCKIMKDSVNYKIMNANMAQHTLQAVDDMYRSFISLLKIKKSGDNKWVRYVTRPRYLPEDGHTTLYIQQFQIISDRFVFPFSLRYLKHHTRFTIKIPSILKDKAHLVKEIRIIPKSKARFFEIQYIYEKEVKEKEYKIKNVLAMDPGVNNFCTCVTNTGKSFIIDGRRLKSINQWYNKESARLNSIRDKQKIKGYTLRLDKVVYNYKNRVNDYMNKAIRYMLNFCKNNDITVLVIGYNPGFSIAGNLGKIQNQRLGQIPYGRFVRKIEYMFKMEGIDTLVVNESYTSKASFFDKDPIPNVDDDYIPEFSGRRVKRGLYRTANGYEFNADVNGALNILRKSNVVSLEALYARGEVDTPIRIRIK